jgi:transposase
MFFCFILDRFISECPSYHSFISECPSYHQFAANITKPTSLIVDNAPTHTSNEFKAQIEKWRELGLTIVPISPYSPELNIIEIVWRKIKYEWLPFSAYDSYETLKAELFNVLANIGKKSFHINFA